MKGAFSTRRIPALPFALALLLAALFSSVGADPAPNRDKRWIDLPSNRAVVHRLKLNEGFLGSSEEGWDQVARTPRFEGVKCILLPDGAMAHEKPPLADRSSETLANWFATTYKEQNVQARGTSVRGGLDVRIYSRGPEVLPRNEVKIVACRKLGNRIQVQLAVPPNQGFTTRMKDSPWWPLLELPLEKLPPGVYALEVVWHDKQGDFDRADRHLTAFSVSANDRRKQTTTR